MTTRTIGSDEQARANSPSSAPHSRRSLDKSRHRYPGSVVALILMIVVGTVIVAWQSTALTPTFHIDGAFQTASGLMRILSGDVPARDFLPYLGIGPILLMFPIFALVGGDLAATVFASHLTSLFVAELTAATLAMLVWKRRSLVVALIAAVVPVLIMLTMNLWDPVVSDVCAQCSHGLLVPMTPGVSLRPVRAAAPYILAAVMLITMLSSRRPRTQAVIIGVASGVVAALWSNDYGLVSGFGGLVVAGLIGVVTFHWQRRNLVWLIGSAVVTIPVVGFLATGGAYLSYLKYNFSDVRADQFWYFGPWDLDRRIFDLEDMVGHTPGLPIAVLGVVAILALIKRDIFSWLLAYLGAALFLGGAVATYGGHVSLYFWPLTLWSGVVLAVFTQWCAIKLGRFLRHRSNPSRRTLGTKRVMSFAGFVSAAVLLLGSVTAVVGELNHRNQLAHDPDMYYNSEFGSYLPTGYRSLLATEVDSDDVVIEEYSGLLSAQNGPRSGLRVDAVIHALGSERPVFEAVMKASPDLVVTTRPALSEWLGWNLSANWWFYRELFRTYIPAISSPTTINWTPSEPTAWPTVDCAVGADGKSVVVQTEPNALYEVTVDYGGPGAGGRAFSMIYNNIAYANSADGYVALDPGMTSQRFPFYAIKSGKTRLPLIDVPANDDEPLTTLTGCSAVSIKNAKGAKTFELYEDLLAGYSSELGRNGATAAN